jgi:hypothetical protein
MPLMAHAITNTGKGGSAASRANPIEEINAPIVSTCPRHQQRRSGWLVTRGTYNAGGDFSACAYIEQCP